MRSKLLTSFLFVAFFWWTLTTLWWSLSDPELNRQALAALAHTFWFLHLSVPDHVSILDAFSIQREVLTYWTLPIFVAVGVFAGIGQGLVWMGAKKKAEERASRERPGAEYRGINITLGAMPRPRGLKLDVLELGNDDADRLATLTEKEKTLLLQILGVLSANSSAYAGEGHAVTILELAVAAVEQALSHKTRPGLAAVVAAANELGKITAYTKDSNGGWLVTKELCRESATHLANLSGWWALPLDDRMAVSFAVRYNAYPDTLIDAGGNKSVLGLARSLLYKAAAATEKASTEERERVLAKQELPDLALKVFLDNLNQIPFQDGLPKGVQAFGWKIGSRVYLLEIKLRESLLAKLPEDVRGALSAKEKRGLHPFTTELMKAFNTKGWLVKEHNGVRVTPREALWNIQAGKLPYKGVIILDIPAEYREMLPAKESIYKVDITGPLFSSAGGSSMSSKDMANMGLVGVGSGEQRKPAQRTSEPRTPQQEAVPETSAAEAKVQDEFDLELAGLKPAARTRPTSDAVLRPAKASAPVTPATPVAAPGQAFASVSEPASRVDAPVPVEPQKAPVNTEATAPAPAVEAKPLAPRADEAQANSRPAPVKTAGISAAQKAKNEMLDLLREPSREVRLSAKDAARQAQQRSAQRQQTGGGSGGHASSQKPAAPRPREATVAKPVPESQEKPI
jgi:hypothetical protein